jgi:hypothetical protein
MARMSLLGAAISQAYKVRRNAVAFGFLRTAIGLAIGATVMEWGRLDIGIRAYALLAVVHLVSWSLAVGLFYGRANGGWAKPLVSVLAGTACSRVLDVPMFILLLPFALHTC